MTRLPLEQAVARLRLLTPNARFFQHVEVPAGRIEGESSDQSFQYVSLYEHRIGNSVRPLGGFTFIIANGFVTSHAYNLALCWLWHRRLSDRQRLDALLRHNYKKFFAESCIARRSRLIGRALLVETLVYEQDLMQAVFDAAAKDENLGRLGHDIARHISSLVSQHELMHYFLRRSRIESEAHAAALFEGALGDLYEDAKARYGRPVADEILCDGLAAHQAVVATQDSPLGGYDIVLRARITAFAYLVLSDLIALELSAHATATEGDDDAIDLASEKRPQVAFQYTLGRSELVDLRVRAIVNLLDRHLASNGELLFGDDSRFPFPATTADELRSACDRFAEPIEPRDGGMTGTDLRRRGLAQLLAESLHDHPRGAELLLWRSKRFTVGGEPIDP